MPSAEEKLPSPPTDSNPADDAKAEKAAPDTATPKDKSSSLDDILLTSSEDFQRYSADLSNRLQSVAHSEFYPDLIEHFLTGITKSLPMDQLRRLNASLQAIVTRKERDERGSQGKRSKKPQLRDDSRSQKPPGDYDDNYDYDEDD